MNDIMPVLPLPSPISVDIAHGVVTLHGDVDTWTERNDAESEVRSLAGVRAVENRVSVRPSHVSPHITQKQIEQAIERHSGIAASRIHVHIAGGVANLSGRVDSWAERKAIERIAGSMEGVQDIENGLTVDTLH